MFRDLFYEYIPRPWHWFFPMLVGLIPFWLIRKYGYDPIAVVFAVYLYFIGVCVSMWMYKVGVLVQQIKMLAHEISPQEAPKPEPGPKTYPNLGLRLKSVNEYQYSVGLVHPPDLRWKEWATAMINGQPVTQTRWAGGKKKFSKPEYAARMNAWFSEGKLKTKSKKGNVNQGYEPNGAKGWEYFKALADGRENIPLPEKAYK